MAACLLIAFAVTAVSAAEMVIEVKNPFKAGNTAFPAGKYRISTGRGAMDRNIVIRNLDKGSDAVVPYITRLSPRDENKGSVVFDSTDGQYFLAEVYFGKEDGFHLQGAPGNHTHVKAIAGESK